MTRACDQLLYGATCDIILLTMALAIRDSNLTSTILQNNHTDSALPPVGQGGCPPSLSQATRHIKTFKTRKERHILIPRFEKKLQIICRTLKSDGATRSGLNCQELNPPLIQQMSDLKHHPAHGVFGRLFGATWQTTAASSFGSHKICLGES